MAARYNSTVAAVILGWLRAEGVVAIPRASNPYHLAANAKALKSPLLLSEADLQLVQALDHILDQSGDSP